MCARVSLRIRTLEHLSSFSFSSTAGVVTYPAPFSTRVRVQNVYARAPDVSLDRLYHGNVPIFLHVCI